MTVSDSKPTRNRDAGAAAVTRHRQLNEGDVIGTLLNPDTYVIVDRIGLSVQFIPFIDEARPVVMSIDLADQLGLTDRLNGRNRTSGIVWLTEAELLTLGASRVEWGEPDRNGWYEPTLYSEPFVESVP
jgi:hypothetical protein